MPSSSAESFFTSWLGRRKNEVSPSTHLRYGAIVKDFLAFLGPRAQEDLSAVSPSDIRQFRDYQADRMSAVSANLSVKVVRNAFKSVGRGMICAPGKSSASVLPVNAMPDIGNIERSHEYELGHSDRELGRLNTQALLVDPMTRQFFAQAGIAAGMRVLDVGSGAGDVALLAADMVGTSGEVVGTDRSPIAVAAAHKAAQARGLSNLSFRQGDASGLEFDRPFDAIVGRYVLCFSPNPVAMLKHLLGQLKPGGIVVFHEAGGLGAASFPPVPSYDRCHEWIVQTFRKVGTNPQMCLDLYSTFLDAGLPAPTMGLQTLVGGSASRPNGIDLIADLVTTMAPAIEQTGVATAEEIDIATLHSRVHADVAKSRSVVVGRYEVGAWSRLP